MLSQFDNTFVHAMDDDPTSFHEAISRSDRKQWYIAMKNEILSLEKMGTWEYVPRPQGANIIGMKFVYKIKQKADGSINRYKARLVAQGFKQVEGVDFKDNDRYTPVTRMTAARIILSWAATMDYEIHQVDVKSAYLYGELNDDEIIYIHPPPGNLSQCTKGQVLKLRKAL